MATDFELGLPASLADIKAAAAAAEQEYLAGTVPSFERTWDGFAYGGPDTGRYGGWIQTFTERQFWPLDARIEDIDVLDIAHALSNQCRFSGHSARHYSVAEHSVRVAQLLADAGHDVEAQLWGLVHDAPEAYMVDLPRPIKYSPGFEAYREAEDRLMRVVCRWAKLPLEQPHVVELADRRLLATERRDLLGPNCQWHVPDTVPLSESIASISPYQDSHEFWERTFLRRYATLADLLEVSRG